MANITRRRHVPSDGSTRRLWIYFAVFAFVLVDVLLVFWAVSAKNAPPAEMTPAASARPIETPTPTPSPTSTPLPPEDVVAAVTTAVPPTRIITALNDMVAWRATTGPCPDTPATPEYTLDGGITWTATDATDPTDVTALQSITVDAESIASMVGLSGEECIPEFVKTFVAGDNYRSYPEQLEDEWFIDPADRASVHSPQGVVSAPCAEAVVVAARDMKKAGVLCADQSVFFSQDSGETWATSVVPSGAIHLSVATDGYRIIADRNATCAGLQISTASRENGVFSVQCLVTRVTSAGIGEIGVSEAEGALWVWVGDIVKKSLDGGATWEP